MKALLVILGVIGAVLAVALALLLIWRVLATVQVRISVTCALITISSGSIRRETTICNSLFPLVISQTFGNHLVPCSAKIAIARQLITQFEMTR